MANDGWNSESGGTTVSFNVIDGPILNGKANAYEATVNGKRCAVIVNAERDLYAYTWVNEFAGIDKGKYYSQLRWPDVQRAITEEVATYYRTKNDPPPVLSGPEQRELRKRMRELFALIHDAKAKAIKAEDELQSIYKLLNKDGLLSE